MTRPDPPGVCTCDALPAGHDDNQCAMQAWRQYTRAFPGPCKCSHAESLHYRDRKERPTCGISVCGCIEYREAVADSISRHPAGKARDGGAA